MRKQGFTLVELIGVIVILGLVSLIVVPAVSNSVTANKKKLCGVQIDNIITAAKVWGGDNILSLPNLGETPLTITLTQLQNYGYIETNVINPITREVYSPDPVITITKTTAGYTYVIDNDTKASCE